MRAKQAAGKNVSVQKGIRVKMTSDALAIAGTICTVIIVALCSIALSLLLGKLYVIKKPKRNCSSRTRQLQRNKFAYMNKHA